ncbi:Ger(x)C family germination protein [Thermolongibacillus altinsuensis]|uniref:Ger(X)C family germination protein n=1 Tax=Thermolongibacillus altinsuensis TaxID=575256 RepID=A0A4R1QAI0_9BACL|nr:Ger(x)C family spore germination protein [Thermolongibacillus altinsuensis]TCL45938.1 Ger(x)C family germination protein [Thermolongibacillus altinsuensis]
MNGRIALFCLSLIVLSGCWGAKEIDHIAYIHAIGIDYEEEKDELIVYAQLISFTGLAKVEAGGQREQSIVSIGKAKGETFNVATDRLYETIQQQVSWGHLKGIIFSERALKKKNMKNTIDVLSRYNEVRDTLWIYATNQPIRNVLQTVPLLNYSPYYSLIANPEDIFNQSSFISPIRLHAFIAASEEKAKTVYLPSLSVDKKAWEEQEKKKDMLKIDRVCFLHAYKLKACVKRDQLIGLRWMTAKTKRTPVYIKKDDKTVASLVVLDPKTNISYKIEKGKPLFTVNVSTKGSILEMREALKEKELISLAEKTVQQEIESLFQLGLEKNVDTLNLSEALYRQNPKQWRKYAKNGQIPLTEDSLHQVNVQISIETYGKSKQEEKR